jgi:biotin operon repressor
MKKKSNRPHTSKIISILEGATKPVSASALKARANMTYDSVAKRIHDLRENGYQIDTVTRKGVDGAKATTYTLR